MKEGQTFRPDPSRSSDSALLMPPSRYGNDPREHRLELAGTPYTRPRSRRPILLRAESVAVKFCSLPLLALPLSYLLMGTVVS